MRGRLRYDSAMRLQVGLCLLVASLSCPTAFAQSEMPPAPPEVLALMRKYIDQWNTNPKNSAPLWVYQLTPGDIIPIPDVTFGKAGEPKAGMSQPVQANLIVLNRGMIWQSKLQSFFHEYGHTVFKEDHPNADEATQEAEAIRYSLEALARRAMRAWHIERRRNKWTWR